MVGPFWVCCGSGCPVAQKRLCTWPPKKRRPFSAHIRQKVPMDLPAASARDHGGDVGDGNDKDLTRSINDSEFLFWCCDAQAGPKPSLLRRVGAELHSPSNMFLGLPLRFKSVLWNSGRICLTTVRIGTSLSFLIYLQTREILIIINLLKFPQNSSANEFCKRHLLTRKRFLYFCSRFL